MQAKDRNLSLFGMCCSSEAVSAWNAFVAVHVTDEISDMLFVESENRSRASGARYFQ